LRFKLIDLGYTITYQKILLEVVFLKKAQLTIFIIIAAISLMIVSCTRAPTPEEITKWCPKPVALDTGIDNLLNDTENNGNTQTTEDLEGLQSFSFKEGELVSFPKLAMKDADGDPITYTFTSPLDGMGKWQTEIGDSGKYKITITATDSKGASSSKDIVVEILAVNRAPSISLEDLSVDEGETVMLNPEVTDADGDSTTISYSGWMDSSEKETDHNDAGTYEVTVKAVDSKGAEAVKTVKIIVNNVNRKPVISELAEINVKETDLVKVTPQVTDPDGDTVEITFSNPLDNDGEWQTKVGDAGTFEATVKASDGESEVEAPVKITVAALNNAPILTLAEDQITVQETDTVSIEAAAEDYDGDKVVITYSGWMSSSTKETNYNDAGEYEVTVSATDAKGAKTEKKVAVTVEDKNRPPEIVI